MAYSPLVASLRNALRLAVPASALALGACADSSTAPHNTVTVPSVTADVATSDFGPSVLRVAANQQQTPYLTLNGVAISGGYGSAIAVDPNRSFTFYSLTDRGPNYAVGDDIAFPMPTYTPKIGRFRLNGTTLVREADIELKDGSGHPMSGLPNPAGLGGTGEIALDINGNPLGTDVNGIDSEGLVAEKNGFWVSEEYGPSIVHFDLTGRQIERVTPFSSPRALPKVFASRRPNKGMEGLAAMPGTNFLVGAMQSPLDNPAKDGKNSQLVRLVVYDRVSGASRQYVYQLDNNKALISEIAFLSPTSALVLERDSKFPGDPADPSKLKRVYKITLGTATDVSDPTNSAQGKLFGGKTLEQLTLADMTTYNVVPVQKTLVVDLLPLGYTHDKSEGLTVLDSHNIAISNDDDFGVTDNGVGGLAQKILPMTGKIDANEIFFVHFDKPLF